MVWTDLLWPKAAHVHLGPVFLILLLIRAVATVWLHTALHKPAALALTGLCILDKKQIRGKKKKLHKLFTFTVVTNLIGHT